MSSTVPGGGEVFLSTSQAAGAGGVSSESNNRLKRRLDGYGTASGPYKRPYPKLSLWRKEFAVPQGSLTADTISFEVEFPEKVMGRFRDDCIKIKFRLLLPNAGYTAAALAAYNRDKAANARLVKPENAFEEVHTRPLDHDPAVYVDEFVQGQFAFSKVDVTMDGVAIDNGNQGDQGFHYTAVNRTFARDRLRKEKYGRSFAGVANSNERIIGAPVAATEARSERPAIRALQAADGLVVDLQTAQAAIAYVPAVPRQTHPKLAVAMKSLQFDARGESEPLLMSLGFDGVFPLSSENNALRTLSSQKNGTGQLRPGTKIHIQLHRRGDGKDGILVERLSVDDTAYWGGAAIPNANADPGLKLKIESIVLAYEVAVLEDKADSEKIQGLTKPLRYYHDLPIMRTNQLQSGIMFDVQNIVLPQHCRFIYLLYLHEVQIVPNARANNFLSARHRWPPGLETVKLDLLGKEGLITKDGLHGLGLKEGHASVSLDNLHADMIRRGLYERPFDDWFPPGNAVGYQQVLLLDLLPYMEHCDKAMVNLRVSMTYNTAAPERWSLRAYCMVQRCYEYTKLKKWTWSDI